MKQDKKNTYNGWTNYETWVVHLWLTNDEASYLHWRERTRQVVADSENSEDEPAARQLAVEICDAIEEECAVEAACLAADLMNAALAEVDWQEIAEAFIDDVPPPPTNPVGLFPLGQIVATPGALEKVPHEERVRALFRHSKGDWGDVDPEDWAENELSLKESFRLLSAYHTDEARMKFWIITEADRSVTTILLPEEY